MSPARSAPPPGLANRRAGAADAPAVGELTRLAYAKWIPVVGREPTPMTADYDRIVREISSVDGRVDPQKLDAIARLGYDQYAGVQEVFTMTRPK